ncbi:hypothetical protein CYMTET_37247 [Cymbomonas tetramitiformis]|uniref:Uncharacterized protein n=1 Tax=Cymbomonas tetramitiformis TaxID=36881 RepID=A0AAE0CGH8_9CHLO|nr:hypothetical protein CYMTET_37247 [Cymbomonas tetramitiformis]
MAQSRVPDEGSPVRPLVELLVHNPWLLTQPLVRPLVQPLVHGPWLQAQPLVRPLVQPLVHGPWLQAQPLVRPLVQPLVHGPWLQAQPLAQPLDIARRGLRSTAVKWDAQPEADAKESAAAQRSAARGQRRCSGAHSWKRGAPLLVSEEEPAVARCSSQRTAAPPQGHGIAPLTLSRITEVRPQEHAQHL